MHQRCYLSGLLLLWHLMSLRCGFISCHPQFVETFMDYKKNHNDDEINYKFHYFIDHPPSNVFINHSEERNGRQVVGQYGLLEPSGQVRQVHYEVNDEDGVGGGGKGGGGFRTVIRTHTASSRVLQRLFVRGRNQPKVPFRHAKPVAFIF